MWWDSEPRESLFVPFTLQQEVAALQFLFLPSNGRCSDHIFTSSNVGSHWSEDQADLTMNHFTWYRERWNVRIWKHLRARWRDCCSITTIAVKDQRWKSRPSHVTLGSCSPTHSQVPKWGRERGMGSFPKQPSSGRMAEPLTGLSHYPSNDLHMVSQQSAVSHMMVSLKPGIIGWRSGS